MILPPRKASVETHEEEQKRLRSFDEILERLKRLKAQDEVRLHHLFDDEEIHRMCATLNVEFRDRVFTPAVTLGLFVSQVLSWGDACITVMAKFNRERKDRGLLPVSEDASAYTKASARLPVELIDHLNLHAGFTSPEWQRCDEM